MNDKKDFKVIDGGYIEPIDNTDILFERADSGEKVMSIKPVAMKTKLSDNQLKRLVENMREDKDIMITHDSYLLKENIERKRIYDLDEMFRDNDKVTVFDPYKFKK